MPPVQLGCMAHGVSVQSPDIIIKRAQSAEAYGFTRVGAADSQSIAREVYVAMTLMAVNTRNVLIGPFVSNPLTRHPAVSASGMASIDEASGGRAYFGISTGDSAVYNLGFKGASLATLEEYVRCMRDLYHKGEGTWQGRPCRLTWAKRPVPIHIVAEGPKTLRLAGRIADGIAVGTGILPEVVQDSLRHIQAGAEESGRRLEDIDIWWFVKANLCNRREDGLLESRMTLAASANHAFRFTLENKMIPEEIKPRILKLQQQYVFQEHESLGATKRNAELVDELGLRDYLADRFTIIGPPEYFVEKVQGLVDMGVKKVHFGIYSHDPLGFIKGMGERVLPYIKEPTPGETKTRRTL
ncbi:MAG: LLM class flavin-dependent oxidoreductase [Chloroflexi bacterium]|nr:LLM class flavin-dependent oxidoreductase [Chloroflexota bacterium]